jgi:carbonic anhydrase
MGHAQCGGVRALVYGAPPQARDFVAAWVEIGKAALPASGTPNLAEVEAGVVRLSMKNLMTFPWIAEAVEAGRLSVQGFMFDIHTGILSRVTPDGVEPVA